MIIIVRGACSVGKTSVARALAHTLARSAHVDCDDMMPWMSDATLEALRRSDTPGFAGMLNAWLVATAEVLDTHGMHMIVDWHFPVDSELTDLTEQLTERALPHCVFNLLCSPEEHLRRDRQRQEEAQIGRGGIEYFLREGSWIDSPHGVDIDTTASTVEAVADTIRAHIEARVGLEDATNPVAGDEKHENGHSGSGVPAS